MSAVSVWGMLHQLLFTCRPSIPVLVAVSVTRAVFPPKGGRGVLPPPFFLANYPLMWSLECVFDLVNFVLFFTPFPVSFVGKTGNVQSQNCNVVMWGGGGGGGGGGGMRYVLAYIPALIPWIAIASGV